MEKENSYKCQMCGGNMVFDPVTQTLKCENCGTEIQIQDDGSGMVEHSLDHRAKNTVKASEKTSRTMKCNGCGAMIEVEAKESFLPIAYTSVPGASACGVVVPTSSEEHAAINTAVITSNKIFFIFSELFFGG